MIYFELLSYRTHKVVATLSVESILSIIPCGRRLQVFTIGDKAYKCDCINKVGVESDDKVGV